MAGSRRPYGGALPVYFVQAWSMVSVARRPSAGSSSWISRSAVALMLSQWYGFSGFISSTVICGLRRIHSVFLRCSARLSSTLSPV